MGTSRDPSVRVSSSEFGSTPGGRFVILVWMILCAAVNIMIPF
jgi:hypothetical protein